MFTSTASSAELSQAAIDRPDIHSIMREKQLHKQSRRPLKKYMLSNSVESSLLLCLFLYLYFLLVVFSLCPSDLFIFYYTSQSND